MLLDIVGRVRNTQLPISTPLLPLYEAIINSIEAIEEANNKNGRIDIYIKRAEGLQNKEGSILDEITGFVIKDNGLGFTDANFSYFQTSDTTYKVERGGKGVGRFLWLKAFDKVEIESVYREGDSFKKRQFAFVPEDDGIKNHSVKNIDQTERNTEIQLIGFSSKYQKYCPKRLETITAHILEYCLEYFIRPYCPQIFLHDDSQVTNLNDNFEGEMLKKETMEFEIGGEKFWGIGVKLRSSYATDHFVHYCSDNRVVKSERLSGRIPNLRGKLQDGDGQGFYFAAYIESELLNLSVNSERTNFVLPEETKDLYDDLSWKKITEAVLEQCIKVLKPFTDPIKESRIREINNYIAEKAPIYRPLIKYINEKVDNIQYDADEKQLEVEIFKVYQEVQNELKKESQTMAECEEIDDFDEYKKVSQEYFNKIIDINKSDLARYVCHRKAVLDFLQKQIEIQQDGKYSKENVIHNTIFPMGKTSDEILIDDHNLWLLDERLVYHTFLASDKPLNSVEVIECDSRKEPDLLVANTYDKACAFSDSDPLSISSIVLVEFKKPMRSNYTDSDNPIKQLMNYIDDINSGKAKTTKGRYISVSSKPIPYYCFIVGDIDTTLRKFASQYNFFNTPDGQGFFGFNTNYNAYFEIVSYDKMIGDANKRNRILFDKLNL